MRPLGSSRDQSFSELIGEDARQGRGSRCRQLPRSRCRRLILPKPSALSREALLPPRSWTTWAPGWARAGHLTSPRGVCHLAGWGRGIGKGAPSPGAPYPGAPPFSPPPSPGAAPRCREASASLVLSARASPPGSRGNCSGGWRLAQPSTPSRPAVGGGGRGACACLQPPPRLCSTRLLT